MKKITILAVAAAILVSGTSAFAAPSQKGADRNRSAQTERAERPAKNNNQQKADKNVKSESKA